MASGNAAFVGSIPENYDRYLGPTLFEPYAADLARRIDVPPSGALLELACGTGILTRRLRETLPPQARVVATDLNQAMLDYAATKFPANGVEFHQVDACEIPFADESFAAVACQFGLMFVPEKARAFAEAWRVLRTGGVFAFNTWGRLDENDLPKLAHETIARFFPADPPQFYQVPFSMHDGEAVQELARAAGFREVEMEETSFESTSPSAHDLTKGLVLGNPVFGAIMDRKPEALPDILEAVESAVANSCGASPVRSRMKALVFVASKA